MSVTKTLSLTNGQQLLDLNGDSINFDITFSAKSLDNCPFDAIVVDQSTLDNNSILDFQRVQDGIISANIVSDKNVYQNYYLCLKAEKPCQVEVVINKKEIKANVPSLDSLASQSLKTSLKPPSKQDKTNWLFIGIVIIIILGSFYYYYYIYKKNKNNNTNQETTITSNEIFDVYSSPPKTSEHVPNPFYERLAELLT
jgi:hypothetical protein